jgi:hypothetical protein
VTDICGVCERQIAGAYRDTAPVALCDGGIDCFRLGYENEKIKAELLARVIETWQREYQSADERASRAEVRAAKWMRSYIAEVAGSALAEEKEKP